MKARVAVVSSLVAISVALGGCGQGPVAGRRPSSDAPHPPPLSTPSPSPSALSAPTPKPTPVGARAASSPSTPRYSVECVASQLVLTVGPRVVETTTQDTLNLVLTNDSAEGCYLDGYPGVSFVDRRDEPLPFDDAWSGDQMVTSDSPVPVEVAPDRAAYIRVDTVPCSGQPVGQASDVRVIPPNDDDWLQVSLAGAVAISACAANDPGRVEHVSPVEPSLRATAAGE